MSYKSEQLIEGKMPVERVYVSGETGGACYDFDGSQDLEVTDPAMLVGTPYATKPKNRLNGSDWSAYLNGGF